MIGSSGRILLEDTTGDGAVTLRPIRFKDVDVLISVTLPWTTLNSDLRETLFEPHLPERNALR
jgi:hypothetical protein